MQMRRAAACLMVATALAAGCSGGGKGDTKTELGGATTTAPATTTTAGDQRTAADLQADDATAKRIALTQADLPPGWTTDPTDPEGDSGASDRASKNEYAACLHVKPEDVAPGDPEFDSPTFTNLAGDQVDITVTMTASA